MMSHAGPLDGSSLVWPSDAAEGMACEQRPVGVIAHAQQEGSSGGDGGQVSPCGLTSTSAQSGAHPFGRLEPPVVAGHHGESSIRRPSAEEAAALALLQLSAASRLRSSNTAASEGSLGSSRPNATLPEAWIEGESVQQQQVEAPAMSAQPTRPYASTSPEALFAQAFYDIPRLEPQTVLPKFDEGRALSKVRGVYNAMPFMWRAQRLLSLQTISQDELRKLKNSAELLVSHCLRYEGRSVYAYKTSRAVEKLAMRFLMLDTVFCTLQLLGETVAAGWWKEFTSSMPCEVRDFDSSSFLTQQRRFNAALARRLSEAMKCFRKGVRPPRSQIIWLKRMLFCSPRAPEPLRIFLVEKAKELLERLC
ncbi:hypothetical protein EPH_0046810 [Eimeria praecox]|uniref:Uncharacterized protein n=1 Tax=Eimeria praecox TaxID=51316 RepID=U6H5L1_9EIME|nr:hypothetical protein EPH_0046810 [Eimeria praecox]